MSEPDAVTLLDEHGRLTEQGERALELAAGQPDPDSLAAASALRRAVDPELAAAALTQESLRRKGFVKFGDRAAGLFFTPAGLEQATRPVVSQWRASQLVERGATAVVDLGCGIGADSLAFGEAGLAVTAVERDAATARVARANLGPGVEVTVADAEEMVLTDDQFAFCDPARRDGSGRVWNVEDFSPGWDFVTGLLRRESGAWIKLGPALPHRLIPDGADATWISVGGDTVEAALTTCTESSDRPGMRAVLLDAKSRSVPVTIDGTTERVDTGDLAGWVHEPDGAVIRAGAVATLAGRHGAHGIADGIAYLTSDAPMESPFATDFEVLEVLPYKEKTLRQWVRDHHIGTLEIKKRGIDVDPAALRKRLKPKGPSAATLVLTPTRGGAKVLVVRRPSPQG